MDSTYHSDRMKPQLVQVWLCGDSTRLRPLLAKLQKMDQAETRLFPSFYDAYCALDHGEQSDFWVAHTTAGDGPCMLPLDWMSLRDAPKQNILLYLVGDDPLPSLICALQTQIQIRYDARNPQGPEHGDHPDQHPDTEI